MGTQALLEGRFGDSITFAKAQYESAKASIDVLTRDRPTTVPQIGTTVFTKPSFPTPTPGLAGITAPDFGITPTLPASVDPSINLPNAPTLDVPVSPINADFVLPEYVSEFSIPEFISKVPLFNTEKISVPEIIALDNNYSSSLNTALRVKLLANINTGGTGLSPTIEAAIFARETERGSQSLQDAIDKTTAQWAKMGFSLPDGMLSSEILALNKEYMNKRLDVSRDISLKQAELEQENIKYSIQTAMALEIKMMEVADNYANRAYEATKATAAITVEVYNANIDAYRAAVQTYSAEAEAFKNFLQQKAVEVEIYNARLAGQKMVGEMNLQNIALFNAVWEGEMNKVKLYEAELQSGVVQLQYIKTALDLQLSELNAYTARSNALIGKYNAQITQFKSEVDLWMSTNDLNMRAADGSLKADIANSDRYIKDQIANVDASKWAYELAYMKLKDTAELSAKVAAGALAAASAQASLSYGEKYEWQSPPTT